ncbi:MAG: hypothetical protein K2P94_04240 [Rhodospirillaceae bacterium]|nr:hypothetical protein [Rhodospirillaceae bacterium]
MTAARVLGTVICVASALVLTACEHNEKTFPSFQFTGKVPVVDSLTDKVEKLFEADPPVIRQPVLPEMLVACRGHVFVPALGMIFVKHGKQPPTEGQYLREERLTPPYRIIPAGANVSVEQSPSRLNVELDKLNRVIGLFCG